LNDVVLQLQKYDVFHMYEMQLKLQEYHYLNGFDFGGAETAGI
jgi:hypothetical protein